MFLRGEGLSGIKSLYAGDKNNEFLFAQASS